MTAQTIGRAGEDYAAEWLICHGYTIVARNYHSRFGEIDIVATNASYIVFVEVKTREQGAVVPPLEAVTKAKQRKLLLTAQQFLAESKTPLQPRFDVAAVTLLHGAPMGLQYFENAFGV